MKTGGQHESLACVSQSRLSTWFAYLRMAQPCTLFLLCSDLGIYKSGDDLLNLCVKACLRDLGLNCLPVNLVDNIIRHRQFVMLRTVCY